MDATAKYPKFGIESDVEVAGSDAPEADPSATPASEVPIPETSYISHVIRLTEELVVKVKLSALPVLAAVTLEMYVPK